MIFDKEPDRVQEKLSREWKSWLYNLDEIRKFVEKADQDWLFVFCGYEGAGKSTLAIQTAEHLDPGFNIKKQMTNDVAEYVKICRKTMDEPFKAIIFDEAVKAFFSREWSKKANVILIKMFIYNRSFNQFNMITIPHFLNLDQYIREDRVRTMLYSWIDQMDYDNRYFAVYHKEKYASILRAGYSAKYDMMNKRRFISKYRPNFIAPFTKVENNEMWEEYKQFKRDEQHKLLNEAEQQLMKLEEKLDGKEIKKADNTVRLIDRLDRIRSKNIREPDEAGFPLLS